jgi:hypothetical protein
MVFALLAEEEARTIKLHNGRGEYVTGTGRQCIVRTMDMRRSLA